MKHCPTESMLSNHFIKPLQDILFRKFRAEIMNIPEGFYEWDMGWEGYKYKRNEMIKLCCVGDNPIPQECVLEDNPGH